MSSLMTPARTFPLARLLVVLPLALAACDASDESFDPAEDDMRAAIALEFSPSFEPFHGRWEGPMLQVDGIAEYNYEATIMLARGICTVSGDNIYGAEWNYTELGVTCTSDLELLEVEVGPDNMRTWLFYDQNTSGPCQDGLVTLTETGESGAMWSTWRDLDGVLDAEGMVDRYALCGGQTSQN